MHNRDAHGLEPSYVQNFVAVEIVNLAVGDEIEIGAANGAGRWQHAERGAEFEDGNLSDPRSVSGEFVNGDARRTNAVLNRNEAATIPVEAVYSGERVVWARRNIDTG